MISVCETRASRGLLSIALACAVVVPLVGCPSRPGNALESNKAAVLRSEAELWSKGNLATADEAYSPAFVCHFINGIEWRGLKGIKEAVTSHRTSFPDWNEHVDDIFAEGDRVAIRITSTGTQLGSFQGLRPTGRKITIQEFHIFRVENGKIAEQWGMPDLQSLMSQLKVTD